MKSPKINLKKRVRVLDNYVVSGKILEAIDAFFHPDVHTQESNGSETFGIHHTRSKLQKLLQGIWIVNRITLHSQAVGDNVTMSEFTFDMTENNGNQILWNEVLRRKWQDGLVIDERYYTANQPKK